MYDHFIAVDWAQSNMAIARMTKHSSTIETRDVPADVGMLKEYLKNLRGRKILTLEETTTSQWLYVELVGAVDKLIVCDPYQNKLLSNGPKNDVIDATKLVKLLRADLLRPVFHSLDRIAELRKLISAYDDLIMRGVRLKNQRSALFRAVGKDKSTKELEGDISTFIVSRLDAAIEQYEADKAAYMDQLKGHLVKSTTLRHLEQIPGIGVIGAVKIGSIVVNAARFPDRNHFHSYCGLVRLEKMSGGQSYGSKSPRCRRDLKAVFKTAALCATQHDNCFNTYYQYLIKQKRYPDHNARHAVARLIATTALGVMRSGKKFKPEKIGALKALLT
jgi:transposase